MGINNAIDLVYPLVDCVIDLALDEVLALLDFTIDGRCRLFGFVDDRANRRLVDNRLEFADDFVDDALDFVPRILPTTFWMAPPTLMPASRSNRSMASGIRRHSAASTPAANFLRIH